MTSLSLEEIVKWAIAGFLIVIGLYLLYINFIPGASEQFWGKINNATGFLKFGQEKLDYEFEIPKSMENNIKEVDKTISNLFKSEEKVSKEELTLDDFKECELTFESLSDGNLRIVVKTGIGQLKYYKIVTEKHYKPCIVTFASKTLTEFEFDDEFKKDNMVYPSTIKIVELPNKLNILKPSQLEIKALSEDGSSEDFVISNKVDNMYKIDMYRIDDDICFAAYKNEQ